MSATCLHSTAVMSLPKSHYGPKDRLVLGAEANVQARKDESERQCCCFPQSLQTIFFLPLFPSHLRPSIYDIIRISAYFKGHGRKTEK